MASRYDPLLLTPTQAGISPVFLPKDDPIMARLYNQTTSPPGGTSLLMIMEQVGWETEGSIEV